MATPLLFDHSEQDCSVLYILKQNITHETTKSKVLYKTTKDMFYKQFDFFLRIDRALSFMQISLQSHNEEDMKIK